jgi:hypothetical protein
MKAIYSANDNCLLQFSEGRSVEEARSHFQSKAFNLIYCAPSCKDVGWKDGQVLEDGKDYQLREVLWADKNFPREIGRSKVWAYPIKTELESIRVKPSTPSTEDQDELWELVIDTILKNKRSDSRLLAELKWMIHLTKIH